MTYADLITAILIPLMILLYRDLYGRQAAFAEQLKQRFHDEIDEAKQQIRDLRRDNDFRNLEQRIYRDLDSLQRTISVLREEIASWGEFRTHFTASRIHDAEQIRNPQRGSDSTKERLNDETEEIKEQPSQVMAAISRGQEE